MLEKYRSDILRAMALVEAVIDFGEDQNLEGNEHIMDNGPCNPIISASRVVDRKRSQAYS